MGQGGQYTGTDLSDLSGSKPFQTNRILLPQIKMKDETLRLPGELKLFKRQTLVGGGATFKMAEE